MSFFSDLTRFYNQNEEKSSSADVSKEASANSLLALYIIGGIVAFIIAIIGILIHLIHSGWSILNNFKYVCVIKWYSFIYLGSFFFYKSCSVNYTGNVYFSFTLNLGLVLVKNLKKTCKIKVTVKFCIENIFYMCLKTSFYEDMYVQIFYW